MNIIPLLNHLKIQDRDTGLVLPWDRNWAQDEFIDTFQSEWNAGRPVRIIVLKARQLGISTATGGIMFTLSFLNNDRNSMIIAHEMDSSEHLLSISKRYWENYAFKALYTTQYKGKKHLAWNETRSQIRVTTAGNEDAGRSKTIQYLHCSEVAFWDDAETLMLGLRQTVPTAPHTFICMESTANGVGNYFYKEWNAAVAGETQFIPLFFPWWKHPDYCASHIGLSPVVRNLTDEERILKRLGVDDDHLAWRRYAIPDLCGGDVDKFHQEYPSDPEEAFVSTGRNVFPIGALQRCYEKMEGKRGRLIRDPSTRTGIAFQPDITGPLTIFKPPSDDLDWGNYFIGGDPTHTTRGDLAVAQVINRRTYEQVAVLRVRCDPVSFAHELAQLGTYYNTAVIATEATGPGYATIGGLVTSDYPRLWKARWADKTPGMVASTYGWNTTHKSKDWAIGHLIKLVVDNDIRIHDSNTFKEMRDYITLDQGGYGPADEGGHDDTVMSFAIACICHATEEPLAPYGAVLPMAMTAISVDEALDPNYWQQKEWQ